MKKQRAILIAVVPSENRAALNKVRRSARPWKLVVVSPVSPSRLTPRQTEVLRQMVTGIKARGIATRLGISRKTVESHQQALMSRLGIIHLPGLVRYALQNGVLPPDWLAGRDY